MEASPTSGGVEQTAAELSVRAQPDGEQLRLPRAPSNGLALSLERKRLQFYLALVVFDAGLLLGSFALAHSLYPPSWADRDAVLAAFLLLPLFQTIAFYNSTYSREGLTNWKAAAGRGLMALLVSAALLNFFAFFAKSNAEFSRVVFTAGLIGAGVGMVLIRYAAARFIIRNWGPSATNRLLIIAGGPEVKIANLYRIDADEHGLRPDIEDPASLDRLARYLRNMDEVIVSCRLQDRVAWSEALKGSGIHGEVVSAYAREIGALGIVYHHEAKVASLLVSIGQLGIRSRIMKRLFDMSLSLAALLVLLPVMLICALAIRLEDRGSVFFMQRRMGRGNTFFDIFKFRSMRVTQADADGNCSASKDDGRITRVGKFMRRTSIDELPQLINVLKGDMSPIVDGLPVAQSDVIVRCSSDDCAAGIKPPAIA